MATAVLYSPAEVIALPDQVVYLDGEFVPVQEAKVSVFDHGLLYGDGVFEGIRAYNGRVFRLVEHVDRLYDSAKAIALEIPLSKQEFIDAILETLRRNGMREGYIRPVVTRGTGDMGLDPRRCRQPTVIIITTQLQLYPREHYENGLDLVTVSTRTKTAAGLSPAIKSLNYLNNILGKIEANRAGVLEGLMLNEEGYVAEATADNIFIVRRGSLFTPPVYEGILVGVTRGVVMELARKENTPVCEERLTRHQVYIADECFLTGTGAEIIPVVSIDARKIGDGKVGPITKRLLARFREAVNSEGVPIPLEAVPVK